MNKLLRRVSPAELNGVGPQRVDHHAATEAIEIVEDVRENGEDALRRHAENLGDLEPGRPVVINRSHLRSAYKNLEGETRDLLTRIHGRIERFSQAQRDGLSDLTIQIQGGQAGHRWLPVNTVGAYAPGGRYPLPSSVLMTVIPARVAGVTSVWVASPRPSQVTLGAAWVSGADGFLAVGGAQAVAALAFGTVTPPADLIVGPGNKWVTAAKRHLFGEVGIDSLAGPSEILVIADGTAQASLVAADLLAQGEHDIAALPSLITTSERLADAVEQELADQLVGLPTADVARIALGNGRCVIVNDLRTAVEISDTIAPEHLALHVADPHAVVHMVRNYGSLFVGESTTESFSDYGAGPNHVLPTGRRARFGAGLSVMTYLRPATWISIDRPGELINDTVRMARLEGLEAHARAALARSRSG